MNHSSDGVMCLYYEDQIMERVLIICENEKENFILDCPRITYIDETVYH